MEYSEEEVEIDFAEVLHTLQKNLVLIILLAVIFGGSAFAIAKFAMTPIYEASVQMIVNTRADTSATVTNDNINSAAKMVDVYAIIIKSNTVLNKVIDNLDLDMSYNQLYNCLSVSAVGSTQVMKVVVKNSNGNLAGEIVDEISRLAPDIIVDAVDAGSCKKISDVIISDYPVSPNKTKYAIIGAAVGVLLGVVIAIIKMLTHNTIVDDEDIKKYLDLPVLGMIPEISEEYHG